VLLSPGAESNSATTRLAAQVKQKALEERNAANNRMCFPKQFLPGLYSQAEDHSFFQSQKGRGAEGPVGEWEGRDIGL
jgi:hypothetical protein